MERGCKDVVMKLRWLTLVGFDAKGGWNSAIGGLDFVDLDSGGGFLWISVLRDILIMEIGDID